VSSFGFQTLITQIKADSILCVSAQMLVIIISSYVFKMLFIKKNVKTVRRDVRNGACEVPYIRKTKNINTLRNISNSYSKRIYGLYHPATSCHPSKGWEYFVSFRKSLQTFCKNCCLSQLRFLIDHKLDVLLEL